MNSTLIFTFVTFSVLGLIYFAFGDTLRLPQVCNRCSPPICGQKYNGTFMPGTHRLFSNICEFNKINSLSKPGYVQVPKSECKKTIIIDDTPCAQVCSESAPTICAQKFNGALVPATQRYFSNICELNNLNCLIKPGYVEVPASECWNVDNSRSTME